MRGSTTIEATISWPEMKMSVAGFMQDWMYDAQSDTKRALPCIAARRKRHAEVSEDMAAGHEYTGLGARMDMQGEQSVTATTLPCNSSTSACAPWSKARAKGLMVGRERMRPACALRAIRGFSLSLVGLMEVRVG